MPLPQWWSEVKHGDWLLLKMPSGTKLGMVLKVSHINGWANMHFLGMRRWVKLRNASDLFKVWVKAGRPKNPPMESLMPVAPPSWIAGPERFIAEYTLPEAAMAMGISENQVRRLLRKRLVGGRRQGRWWIAVDRQSALIYARTRGHDPQEELPKVD